MGPFFQNFKKTGPFQTSKRNKSAKTQQNPINLYIFEISIKFCVDWYIIWCISGKLKIFLYYRWQNLQVANRRWRRSLKIAKKNQRSICTNGQCFPKYRVKILKKLKIFLYYRWQNLQVADRQWRRSLKIAKKNQRSICINGQCFPKYRVKISKKWKYETP